MKTDASVSTSDSEKDIKAKLTGRLSVWLSLVFLLIFYVQISGSSLSNYTVDDIYFKFHDHTELSQTSRYQPLLRLQPGKPLNYVYIRQSMENLYKVGTFDNIEVSVVKKPRLKIDVYFTFLPKYVIKAIKINTTGPTPGDDGWVQTVFNKKDLLKSIFSMREHTYFDDGKLDAVVRELTQFLNSRGYFSPKIIIRPVKNKKNFSLVLKIHVNPGLRTLVDAITLEVHPTVLRRHLNRFFRITHYAPHEISQHIENARKYLKKQKYYYPDIKLSEHFVDQSKEKVNLEIRVDSGYRYNFNFIGMEKRDRLIASIWQKKVFEKWAEKESNARILYYLKNKGYLDAEIQSHIDVNKEKRLKTISFTVKKHSKYKLGKIHLHGNKSIPDEKIREVIKTDDQLFNKFFHLRLSSLLVDREIIRLLYYFQGFPSAKVTTHTGVPQEQIKDPEKIEAANQARRQALKPGGTKKLDITFSVQEGKRFTVESILFEGNSFFTSQTLHSYLQIKINGPFVQQKLNEDLEKIQNLYLFYGFDHIKISPHISAGSEKSILIKIVEGKSFRMGKLVVIGASREQRRLLAHLFPLKENDPFNQLAINSFVKDIENSAIFSEFKLTKIERGNRLKDVLIKVTADYSRYYGFGIGYDGRRYVRGTIEYQGRNVFRSYSTLSAMVQGGLNELRGVLSFDTPYFFKTRINSSLKVWADTEIYPSYKFDRFGIGESLIKKLTPDSFILGSLSWYRTKLTELAITPNNIDREGKFFDTTALNLSYVREKRDDPFNPTQGTFFSTDLKLAFPIFENYSFIKFQWSFQKNIKLLRSGVIALSVRNGLATNKLSITERFFAGGVNSFRGTWRDRLGPLDPIENKPTGGSSLVLLNVETTFPIAILPVNDFYYSVFADIGNVYSTVKSMRLDEMRSAIGIGLKYKTQMGPLRFDLAWDLGETLSWKNLKFHIGIGNVF